MQKRNMKDLNLRIGETLLEYFVRNTTDKSEKNIVQVLAHMNSLIFSQTERKRKEIEEFGNYFVSNGLEEYSRDERTKFFGSKDAYILNIYFKLFEEEEEKLILEEIRDISPEQYIEAKELTDTIFRINENIELTLFTLDGPVEFKYYKNNKPHIESLKQELFNYMAHAIMHATSGSVVVKINKNPKPLLFKIEIKDNSWRPLPVYEFMENEDELDLSVMYTEISR